MTSLKTKILLGLSVLIISLVPAFAQDRFKEISKLSCNSGTLPEEFLVTNLGEALYTIPLEVPPGADGMQPELSLSYSQNKSDGLLGIKWSLNGISAITRCAALPAFDNYRGSVNLDAMDRFCLDGSHLILDSGNYGAHLSEYRTSPDNIAKVVAYNPTGSKVEYFRVFHKSGIVQEFGGNSNSNEGRHEDLSSGQVRKWALSRVYDQTNKYMDFHYQIDANGNAMRIISIEYTGHLGNSSTGAISPSNKIEFRYINRPVAPLHYEGGSTYHLTTLLSEIRTITGFDTGSQAEASRYRLIYEFNQSSGTAHRPRLRRVSRCGTNGAQCLPGTTFTYDNPISTPPSFITSISNQTQFETITGRAKAGAQISDQADWSTSHYQSNVNFESLFTDPDDPNLSTYLVSSLKFGDFNGDGKTDLINITASGGAQVWLMDNNNDINYQGLWVNGGLGNPNQVRFADFNGDGKTDLATFFNGGSQFNTYFSTGTGFSFQTTTWVSVLDPNKIMLADFNGDRRSDIIDFTSDRVWLSNGAGFNNPDIWNTNSSFSGIPYPIDINGDKQTDLIFAHPWLNQYKVSISTGSGFSQVPSTITINPNFPLPSNSYNGTPLMTGDFNGDQLQDVAVIGLDAVKVLISNGKTLVEEPSFELLPNLGYTTYVDYSSNSNSPHKLGVRIGDFNGDGMDDILNFQHPGTGGGLFNGYVKLSNGTSFQTASSVGISDTATNIRYKYPFLGDFNGDSKTDLLRPKWVVFNPNAVSLHVNNGPKPDLLTGVINGYGVITKAIQYLPITNNQVYTKTSSTQTLDGESNDFHYPLFVVRSVKTPNGVDNTGIDTKYFYQGSRIHSSHGFLGFQRMYSETPQTNNSSTTEYQQDFPFIGMASKIETWVGDLQTSLYSKKTNTWDQKQSSNGAKCLYLKDSITEEYEVDGSPTRYDFNLSTSVDNYCNILLKQQYSALDTSLFYEQTQFQNDTTNWHIGFPTFQRIFTRRQGGPLLTRTKNFSYSNGLLSQEVETYLDNDYGSNQTISSSYSRDAFGNITTTQRTGRLDQGSETRTTLTPYDSRGIFPTAEVNPLLLTKQVNFDPRFGTLLTSKDFNNLATTMKYDPYGRVINETRPDGSKTTTSYCAPTIKNLGGGSSIIPSIARSYKLIKKDGAPPLDIYFDALEREIRSVTRNIDNRAIIVDTIYNTDGTVRSVSHPYFLGDPITRTSYSYDATKRLVATTYSNGTQTLVDYVPPFGVIGDSVTNGLAASRSEMRTDALGRAKVYFYDSQGSIVQVQERDRSNGFSIEGKMSYEHDGFGQVTKTLNNSNNLTEYTYDQIGRLISMIDPDRGETKYSYFSAFNNAKYVKDAQGNNLVENSYDILSRLTGKLYKLIDQGTTSQYLTRFFFDSAPNGKGKLASVDHLLNTTLYNESYTYDLLGRPIQESVIYNNDSYISQMTYDSFSRMSEFQYPGAAQFKIKYKYGLNGYLSAVSDITSNQPETLIWQLDDLTADGQVKNDRFGNGVMTTRSFDPDFKTISDIETSSPSPIPGSLVQQLRYSRDPVGRVSHRQDSISGSTEQLFYNDPMRRLSGYTACGTLGCKTTNLSYNSIGNILNKTDVGSYSYGNGLNGGPHAITATSGGIASGTFTGYVRGDPTNYLSETFKWNTLSMVARIASEHLGNVEFLYGPFGNKFEYTQTFPQNKRTRYINRNFEEHVFLSNGTYKEHHYVRAYGIPVALLVNSSTSGKTKYFLHHDYLGSLNAVTSEQGSVLEKLNFDPFGSVRSEDWSSTVGAQLSSIVNYGFEGHEQVGPFIDMKARLYNPRLGRFVNADPTIPDPLNPQAHNRYSFVYNEPMNYTDPSGLTPQIDDHIKESEEEKMRRKRSNTADVVVIVGDRGKNKSQSSNYITHSMDAKKIMEVVTAMPNNVQVSQFRSRVDGVSNHNGARKEDIERKINFFDKFKKMIQGLKLNGRFTYDTYQDYLDQRKRDDHFKEWGNGKLEDKTESDLRRFNPFGNAYYDSKKTLMDTTLSTGEKAFYVFGNVLGVAHNFAGTEKGGDNGLSWPATNGGRFYNVSPISPGNLYRPR